MHELECELNETDSMEIKGNNEIQLKTEEIADIDRELARITLEVEGLSMKEF